jgi:lipoprotein-anchoring transpeptidase ErfK/SrfK
VLTDWQQGGPIGIHGTNEPRSIGRGMSHGCIRVSNGIIGKIFKLSLPGTPVRIQH